MPLWLGGMVIAYDDTISDPDEALMSRAMSTSNRVVDVNVMKVDVM